MKIKTIVEQEVTPPVYIDWLDGTFDCIQRNEDVHNKHPVKIITRADYISRLVKENTGQPLTAQDLDDLRALIGPKETFSYRKGDVVILWRHKGMGFNMSKYVAKAATVNEVLPTGELIVTAYNRKKILWPSHALVIMRRGLVETQQTFKVGDQVVLENFEGKSSYWTPDLIHYHGTIAKVCEVFDQHYGVTLHDNTTAMWHPSGMKHWKPRPPKVGDLVRTDDFKTGTEGLKRRDFVDEFSGKIGIVDGISYNGKPDVHGWYWPVSAVTIIKPAP